MNVMLPGITINFSYLAIVIITLILGGLTQFYISHSYKKYSRISNGVGMTGADAARAMLEAHGIYNVRIRPVSGTLSDHYDPRSRTVNLSDDVYSGTSISSIAVACHECGHAVQHATAYLPMRLRSALVPIVNISSSAWLILLLAGVFLNFVGLIWVAIILFAFATLFHLVTLPVEFNASRRGLEFVRDGLGRGQALSEQTYSGASTVLRAAALTYVAAALTSVLQLLYYASRYLGND